MDGASFCVAAKESPDRPGFVWPPDFVLSREGQTEDRVLVYELVKNRDSWDRVELQEHSVSVPTYQPSLKTPQQAGLDGTMAGPWVKMPGESW